MSTICETKANAGKTIKCEFLYSTHTHAHVGTQFYHRLASVMWKYLIMCVWIDHQFFAAPLILDLYICA